MQPAALIALLVGGTGLLALAAHLLERRKRAALERWAASAGFHYAPDKRQGVAVGWDLFAEGQDPCSRHHAGRVYESGTNGIAFELELFEFQRTTRRYTSRGSRTSRSWFTCARLRTRLDLGLVKIRPETLADKLTQLVGFEDIDFADTEFSKRFVVQAQREEQARALIDTGLMRFLLANRGWSVETCGREILIHARGSASAKSYEQLARFARGLIERLSQAQTPAPLPSERPRGIPRLAS